MSLPPDVREQLDELVSGFITILERDLVGVYLHGSLVLGCFNPQRSDIDLIAVARRSVTQEERRLLGRLALRNSGPLERPRRPPYPLEVSVLTESQLRPWRYPTPFEFHYGESQRERFTAGDFEPLWAEDHDLAAHVTVLTKTGHALHGPAVDEVFPTVPQADYADSLLRDLAWCRQQRLNVYAVLSASRVWATLAEDRLHSKLSGGIWALERAPEDFRSLIGRAVSVYRGESEDDDFEATAVTSYLDYVEPIAGRYARSQNATA